MRDRHPVAQRLYGVRRAVSEVGERMAIWQRQLEPDDTRRRSPTVGGMTGRARRAKDLFARRLGRQRVAQGCWWRDLVLRSNRRRDNEEAKAERCRRTRDRLWDHAMHGSAIAFANEA